MSFEVTVTTPLESTSNLIVVWISSYPSGAAVSASSYLPGRSWNSCVSVVEVHFSTSSPSSSVITIVAPAFSKPVSVAILLILTVCAASAASCIVTFAFLSAVAAVTSAPVTTPFFISNVISVATLYPLGAAFSLSLYVPSGRFFTVVGVSPDMNTKLSPVPSIFAFVPFVTSVSLKVTFFPV